jgi:hypothetical protein
MGDKMKEKENVLGTSIIKGDGVLANKYGL